MIMSEEKESSIGNHMRKRKPNSIQPPRSPTINLTSMQVTRRRWSSTARSKEESGCISAFGHRSCNTCVTTPMSECRAKKEHFFPLLYSAIFRLASQPLPRSRCVL